jgi:hypothetical protein
MTKTVSAILFIYKVQLRMQICLRNPKTECNIDHALKTAGRTKIKMKEITERLKFLLSSSIFRLNEAYSNIFQADLIWCEYTFQ